MAKKRKKKLKAVVGKKTLRKAAKAKTPRKAKPASKKPKLKVMTGKKVKAKTAHKAKTRLKTSHRKLKVKKLKGIKKNLTGKPHSGQSGEKISYLVPSPKEHKVAEYLRAVKKTTIKVLADKVFASKPDKKANSWVRNCLRRLVRSGWVAKVGRGEYEIRAAGLEGLKKNGLGERKRAKLVKSTKSGEGATTSSTVPAAKKPKLKLAKPKKAKTRANAPANGVDTSHTHTESVSPPAA